eukprot:1251840-Rhodomonas_salina.1
MSFPNNFGYGGYMQGGYPMASFPTGQPGMMPPPTMAMAPIAPVQSSMSTPARPNSAEGPRQPVPEQDEARSVEVGAPSSSREVPNTVMSVSHANANDYDDHHEDHHDDHHEEENIPFFGPFGKGFMEDLKTKLP